MQYFPYGEAEVYYLKQKDPVLGAVMDKIGMIKRQTRPDLFEALMHSIVGQQISSKAAQTVWERIVACVGEVTPQTILTAEEAALQSCGLSFRKVDYLKSTAAAVASQAMNLEALYAMDDTDVCVALSQLKGIGVWTAEMLMTFSMCRPNIISYGDLAILKGLRMIYHHRKITPQLFQKYKRRYSPYASVASLYLWAVAGGALPELRDYKPKTKGK